jgi:hypothetical protein
MVLMENCFSIILVVRLPKLARHSRRPGYQTVGKTPSFMCMLLLPWDTATTLMRIGNDDSSNKETESLPVKMKNAAPKKVIPMKKKTNSNKKATATPKAAPKTSKNASKLNSHPIPVASKGTANSCHGS